VDGQTFMNLARIRFKACLEVLEKKNVEYSRDEDKLHNFKRAAMMLQGPRFGCEPEDALVGMWVKHITSIMDMVDDLPDLPTFSILREKITDAINYLVLLEALFVERMDGPEEDTTTKVVSDKDADRILDEVEHAKSVPKRHVGKYPEEWRINFCMDKPYVWS